MTDRIDPADVLGIDPTGRTFATYLDRTERDQLDAKAACAQQERDEALDDRDAYKEARDVLRHQLDRLREQLADMTDQRNERLTLAESSRLAKRCDAAEEERDDYARRLKATDASWAKLAADNDRLRAELGDAQELIAVYDDVTEQLDRARAAYATRQGGMAPGLGSPSPRAQDEPGRRSETGCMGDPDTELRLAGVHPDQEAARRQGYADAIAALRDDSRYMDWWSPTGLKPAGALRRHLAAYLETVGPDGPDVTKPMPEREG